MSRSDAELIGCLQATLSPDGEVRHAAEAALHSGSTQEGFCIGLINIALHDTGVEVGIRQLAAVVLRRNVQQRWIVEDFENAGAESRQISDAEKSQVRALLPAGLAESNSRIQTAVGMAIAEIGRWDCPAHWPELLPGLVRAINEPNNPALVAGAVRCLSMLVEDLGEGQVVEIAPVVLPPLLRFATAASDPGSSSSLRRRALLIFKTALGSLELVYRQEGNAMQVATAVLPPWMQALTAIVAAPTTAHDPGAWGVKFDALGCLVRIVSSFSKLAEDYIPAAMSTTWEMFSSLLPLYQTHVLHSEASNIEGEVSPNEDEAGLDAVSLPELVSQLFEFIMALVGHPKWSTAIRPSFRQLAYLTLGYIQASDADVEQWSTDVNSFLGAEEDFWGPRASGELLLEEITKSSQGMAVVAEAIAARAGESAAARHAGDKDWWRLREAVLLALGYIVGNVIERRTAGKSVPQTLQAESISSGLLNQDIVPGVPPLVAGRAMWLIARLEPMLGPAARAAALRAVGPMLAPGCPGQTQAGACQALARLCRSAEPADIQSVSSNAFAGLCALLPGAEEDSLHLLLETLAALVRADPATAVQYENQLVPGALAAWVNHVNDPLISEDAAALLQSLASSPACLAVLSARALPTLCDVIANPAPHSPILVSGCLDMLVMLLPPSAPDAAKTICSVATRPVLALVAGVDDEEVLASATAVLRTMLQVGGQDALLWGGFGDGSAGVGALLQATQFLMQPQVHDRACRHVGGLLLELMRHAMPLVSPHLPGLLGVLVSKLSSSEDPATVQSFLQVLASLARHDVNQLVECLAGIALQPGVSALQVALQKWTERQIEIRTPYDIRLTTTALGTMLTCPHSALDSIIVRGKRIDEGSGIRTRAKAAHQEEKWSQLPVRVKILILLTDAYIEAATQAEGEDLDDIDEYEWIDDEGEEDENGGDGASDFGSVASRGVAPYDEYGGLLGGFDSEDDDDAELMALANLNPLEAQRRKLDPLSSLDVGQYVAEVVRSVAASAPGLLQTAVAELTPTQVQAMQKNLQQ